MINENIDSSHKGTKNFRITNQLSIENSWQAKRAKDTISQIVDRFHFSFCFCFQLNLMQSYGDIRGGQYYSQKIGKNENILDFWHKTENILYLATRLWARLTFVC